MVIVMILSYFLKTSLFSGASMSGSRLLIPPFRPREKKFVHQLQGFQISIFAVLVALKIAHHALYNPIRTGSGLAISRVPMAAPPMMITSPGCIRTASFPCSNRYPPMMAPITTTIPIIENICLLLSASALLSTLLRTAVREKAKVGPSNSPSYRPIAGNF